MELAKIPRPTSILVQRAMSVVAPRPVSTLCKSKESGERQVVRRTEEVRVRKCMEKWHSNDDGRAGTRKQRLESGRRQKIVVNTHMQAIPRMHPTAIFVRLSICKSLTRKKGRIPTVKSHMPAKILQSQLIAMMTVQLIQWPS